MAATSTAPAAATASGRDPINTFCVMEDICEKLKLLNYEDSILKKRTDLKPLSRTYFAIASKPAEQFPYFAQLAIWSLQQIGNGTEIEWSEWDDPTQTCSLITDNLKKLHFPALVDYPSAKLRAGSGDGVIAVLDFLLDKVLDVKGFRVQPPVYADSASAGGADLAAGAGAADEEDEDEIGDDTIMDDLPHDGQDEMSYAAGGGAGGKDAEEKKEFDPEEEDRRTLTAKTNPIEWSLELERVGPRLKFKTNIAPTKEWRTHLEQSQKHGETLSSQFPQTKTTLEKIGTNLRKATERIAGKEKAINKEFEYLGGEFRGKQQQLDAIQESYNQLTREIADLNTELTEKSEAIESIKSTVNDRNNTMTDVSPLRKLNTSLAQLRKEVAHMELRIGVVAQTLLQAKLKSQHQKHEHKTIH